MTFNICDNWSSKLGNRIDGLKLYIEGIQSEVEYFETGDFEEKNEWILEQSVKCFSEFISTGDLLVDQKLGKIADDVLKLDLKW